MTFLIFIIQYVVAIMINMLVQQHHFIVFKKWTRTSLNPWFFVFQSDCLWKIKSCNSNPTQNYLFSKLFIFLFSPYFGSVKVKKRKKYFQWLSQDLRILKSIHVSTNHSIAHFWKLLASDQVKSFHRKRIWGTNISALTFR